MIAKISTLAAMLAIGSLLRMACAADAPGAGPWVPVAVPDAVKGHALRSVWFVGERHGWVVGDNGLCLTTGDGGSTWTCRASGTQASLRCVRFNDEKHGWACGDGDPKSPKPQGHFVMGRAVESGSLLATADGGASWTQQWIPTNFEIECVEASAAPTLQVGISGGASHLDGDITRTPDGGHAWRSDRCYRALYDIRAIDQKDWAAVGSPVSVGFTPPPDSDLYTQHQCRAIFSADGGEHWRPAQGSDGAACLRAMAVKAGAATLAVGDDATVLTSADGGRTWTAIKLAIPRDLSGVSYAAQGSDVVVATGNAGCILVSQDGGAKWIATAAPPAIDFHGVAATASGFWVVGDQGVLLHATGADLAKAGAIELKALGGSADDEIKRLLAQEPTPRQRALVRVGDYTISRAQIPMMKIDYTMKRTVTSVTAKEFTVDVEVIAGSVPPGNPRKQSVTTILSSLEDPADYIIGKVKVEETVAPMKMRVEELRLPDQTVKVGGVDVPCSVMDVTAKAPGDALTVETKMWTPLGTEVPMQDFVKLERTQICDTPSGKVTIVQQQDMTEFKRGPSGGK